MMDIFRMGDFKRKSINEESFVCVSSDNHVNVDAISKSNNLFRRLKTSAKTSSK